MKGEASILRHAIRNASGGLFVSFAAEILSFDSASNTAKLQAIMVDPRTGERMAPINRVPIVQPAGGGFATRMPVNTGDFALVQVLDYSIDEWLSGGSSDSVPALGWLRNPTHAVAFVGLHTELESVFGSLDPNSLFVGRPDGSAYWQLAPSGVHTIKASQIKLGDTTASDPVVRLSDFQAYVTALNVALGSGANAAGNVVFATPPPGPATLTASPKVFTE